MQNKASMILHLVTDLQPSSIGLLTGLCNLYLKGPWGASLVPMRFG